MDDNSLRQRVSQSAHPKESTQDDETNSLAPDHPTKTLEVENNNGLTELQLKEKENDGLSNPNRTFFNIPLIPYEEVPKWLQDNQFIDHDYRPALNSWRNCFRSVLSLHNETMNIWTHLIPAFVTIILAIQWRAMTSTMELPFEERFMTNLPYFGAFFCFTFSALYHTFSCHSERVLKVFLKLDYAGIIMMVTGSYLPWVHYAFACMENMRKTYYIMGTVFACIATMVSLTSHFDKVECRHIRAGVFFSFIGFLCTSILHYGIVHGFYDLLFRARIDYIGSMVIFYLLGGAVYATRTPEKLRPGCFNVFGHSHQLFHICVVLGAITYYIGMQKIFENRDQLLTCPQ